MQGIIFMLGLAGLLAIISIAFSITGLIWNKPSKKPVNTARPVAQPSHNDLLRKLIRSASTTSVNEAAFGVINTLLSDLNLAFNYVSLLIWTDTRKRMTLLGTNVAQNYGRALVQHINELHEYVVSHNLSACTNTAKDGYLSYPTAEERGVCFEYYLPIYNGKDLIGSIYFESCDRHCHDVVNLDFFSLMLDNISLVLNNIVLMQQILRQANVDKLTQLYNRTYMMQYYEQLQTAKAEYSLILMDIDFFKKCNDTYGHNVGDIVLREVAKVFKTSARSYQDGVFRYGGEEFLIILRDAPLDVLRSRAELIRKNVEKNIACADQALYYSKQHGRNRVTAYSEIPPEELESSDS